MKKEQSRQYVLHFIRREIEIMKNTNRLGLARNCTCAYNSFLRYLSEQGKSEITFRQFSGAQVLAYQDWLWEGGVSKNASSCYMRTLHALYNKAVRRELASGNPFLGAYMGIARTRKRAMDRDDFLRLCRLDIRAALLKEGRSPSSKKFYRMLHQLELARDLFLFCFSTRGMTFVDVAYLRTENIHNGFISYIRKKTKRPIHVKIEPVMQHIVDKYSGNFPYVFPILFTTDTGEAYAQYRKALRVYNLNLKCLSSFLGLEVPLSSYVSRHTWATLAYRQHIPVSVISQAMGHDSERTTQIYLKSFENKVIDDANSGLLNALFSPLLC